MPRPGASVIVPELVMSPVTLLLFTTAMPPVLTTSIVPVLLMLPLTVPMLMLMPASG